MGALVTGIVAACGGEDDASRARGADAGEAGAENPADAGSGGSGGASQVAGAAGSDVAANAGAGGELETGSISGVVTDENGVRVRRARVTVGNKTAETDADGAFEITDAPARKATSVRVEAERHAQTTQLMDVEPGRKTRGNLVTTRAERKRVAVDQDASVEAGRAAKVALPGGGVQRKSDGSEVSEADIEMAHAENPSAMRGAPIGLEMRMNGGPAVRLEAFSMLSVRGFDPDGQPLQLSKKARITLPLLPGVPLSEGDSVEVFVFDSANANWKKHADASVSAGSVEVEIDDFGWYMVGGVMVRGCVRGTLLQSDDTPGAFVGIVASGQGYLGVATSTSDGDGAFCVEGRIGSELLVEAASSWVAQVALSENEGSCADLDSCVDLGALQEAATAACNPSDCAPPPEGLACCDALAGSCQADVGYGCGFAEPFNYSPPDQSGPGGAGGQSGAGGSVSGGSAGTATGGASSGGAASGGMAMGGSVSGSGGSGGSSGGVSGSGGSGGVSGSGGSMGGAGDGGVSGTGFGGSVGGVIDVIGGAATQTL